MATGLSEVKFRNREGADLKIKTVTNSKKARNTTITKPKTHFQFLGFAIIVYSESFSTGDGGLYLLQPLAPLLGNSKDRIITASLAPPTTGLHRSQSTFKLGN